MEYLSAKERDELGLPLRFGDTREDGFRFRQYYKRANHINELWVNEEAFQKVLQRKRTTTKRKRISNRDYARRVKLFLGCSLCGYKKHPDALHFDHVDPAEKLREVSKMHSGSREKLKEEIRKCRILCANCHAEHTANQIKNGVFNETKNAN